MRESSHVIVDSSVLRVPLDVVFLNQRFYPQLDRGGFQREVNLLEDLCNQLIMRERLLGLHYLHDYGIQLVSAILLHLIFCLFHFFIIFLVRLRDLIKGKPKNKAGETLIDLIHFMTFSVCDLIEEWFVVQR